MCRPWGVCGIVGAGLISRDDHGGKSLTREKRVRASSTSSTIHGFRTATRPSIPQPFRVAIRVTMALLSLALVTFGLQSVEATGGGSSKPARIVIDRIFSTITAPDGTPEDAVPYALVLAGEPFSIQVSFVDAAGKPASFDRNTPLSISTDTGAANQPSPATGTAPRGAKSVVLTTSLPNPANQVAVTVSAPTLTGPKAVIPGTSSPDQLFDVLSELRFQPSAPGTPFVGGIGGQADCASVTSADPVCGSLQLPRGAASPQVLLSRGLCDAVYAGCGSTRGSVVQFLADLGVLYTKTSPARMIVRCDKSLCGSQGLTKVKLNYSLLGNAALVPAPACPKKDRIGPSQEACVDYRSSSRDNAGDSHLHLLLTHDARISVS